MKITLIALVIATLLQSCSVWNLSSNTAKLQDNLTFHELELHGGGYMKDTRLGWDVSLGYAGIVKPGFDDSAFSDDYQWMPDYIPALFESEYSGLKLGITPMYYFSDSRFQPFLGCGFNALLFGARETGVENGTTSYAVDSYLYMVPHAGIRFFITRKLGVHANVGYSIGRISHPELSLKTASGLSYSYGLTLTF
jgi:hypothetical protein